MFQGWSFISDQLANANFQKSLTDIKELAQGADTQTPAIIAAIGSIGNFVNLINGSVSDATKTATMVKDLGTHLKSIKFLMQCKVAKGRLLIYVSDHCKIGTNSLANLYTDGVQSFGVNGDNCIIDANGTPYTSFAKLKVSITTKATAEKYNVDCILNNPAKKKEACR